jgi:hypothetical protein
MNLNPLTGIFEGLIGIGRELITDKDKLIEYEFRTKELHQKGMELIVSTQTIPWVDATVKIMYALIAFARPVGSAAMTAFGIYAHYKQIPIDGAIHAVFDGAFPAWGTSRHINKNKEQEEITKRLKKQQYDVLENDL